MKVSTALISISLAGLMASPVTGFAVSHHYNKTVGQLQSTYAGADCIYFTLEGVAEADPINAGSPWFAIPRSQYGAKDAYAMLLSARLSGQVVTVTTSGTLSCGYASVYAVTMQ